MSKTSPPTPPPSPQPQNALSMAQAQRALVSIGGQTFEFNHQTGEMRPFTDQPTAEQLALAKGLEFLGPQLNAHRSIAEPGTAYTGKISYAPISGSNVHHGVYTIQPQDATSMLLDNLQIPYTPDQIQPNSGKEGGWRVHNPSTNDWDIYK